MSHVHACKMKSKTDGEKETESALEKPRPCEEDDMMVVVVDDGWMMVVVVDENAGRVLEMLIKCMRSSAPSGSCTPGAGMHVHVLLEYSRMTAAATPPPPAGGGSTFFGRLLVSLSPSSSSRETAKLPCSAFPPFSITLFQYGSIPCLHLRHRTGQGQLQLLLQGAWIPSSRRR